jgi:hypothetical protein
MRTLMKDLRCSLLAIFLPGASPGAVVSQGEDKAVVDKFIAGQAGPEQGDVFA